MRAPRSPIPFRDARPIEHSMAHVIPFTPRSSSPSGLLRAARERSGLTHADFAALLGPAIGRDHLSPGTIRAWETGAVAPPAEVVEEAQRVAGRVPVTGLDLTAAPKFAP